MKQYRVKYKVLVLDDNRYFLDRLYPKICEINSKNSQYMIECRCVCHQRAFIAELHSSAEYDLIIIDICIRDSIEQEVYDFLRMDIGAEFCGIDLYQEIKHNCPNARIFAMSNLPVEHIRIAFNYSPDVDCFYKGGVNPADEIARCVKAYFDTNMQRIRNNVFLVYGHNESMRTSVDNFLTSLRLHVIDLYQDSKSGIKNVYDALESCGGLADCAIILLSGDDIAYNKEDLKSYRARQNVIFEMGLFAGLLGRGKVIVLHEEKKAFEFPSDINGIFYIQFSNDGSWILKLTNDLKEIGFDLK